MNFVQRTQIWTQLWPVAVVELGSVSCNESVKMTLCWFAFSRRGAVPWVGCGGRPELDRTYLDQNVWSITLNSLVMGHPSHLLDTFIFLKHFIYFKIYVLYCLWCLVWFDFNFLGKSRKGGILHLRYSIDQGQVGGEKIHKLNKFRRCETGGRR